MRITDADQCMYGLKTWSTHKGVNDTPAQKRTRFMTNSDAIATRLSKQCHRRHKHQVLFNGRAKDAAIYPKGLCEAISLGLQEDIRTRRMQLRTLLTVGPEDKVHAGGYLSSINGGEMQKIEQQVAWDDVTGEFLDAKEVLRARLKELQYIR